MFETGQKSQKVIMFYKLAQVKISVGQRWFLVPLMRVTGDWVGARDRTWDSNQKLFRETGHFLFFCFQENIFSVCTREGIVQGQSYCCTGTQFTANFSLSVLHSLFVKEKVFVGEDSFDLRSAASEARASLGWLRLRLLVKQWHAAAFGTNIFAHLVQHTGKGSRCWGDG